MKSVIKHLIPVIILILFVRPTFGQQSELSTKFAARITEEGLRDKLSILASDALE